MNNKKGISVSAKRKQWLGESAIRNAKLIGELTAQGLSFLRFDVGGVVSSSTLPAAAAAATTATAPAAALTVAWPTPLLQPPLPAWLGALTSPTPFPRHCRSTRR